MTTNTRRRGGHPAALAMAGALLAGAAALGASPATAAGTSAEKLAEACPALSVPERAEAADAVVTATVTDVVNGAIGGAGSEDGTETKAPEPTEPVTPGLPGGDAGVPVVESRTVDIAVDESFRGVIEGDVVARVTVKGVVGPDTAEPAIGVRYLMFLTEDRSVIEAGLCDLVPVTSVDPADLETLAQESAANDAEPVTLTPVDGVDDPPSYQAAIVPGAVLVAAGLLGLVGTVALGRISARH